MTKILVTGATGPTGRHVVARLVERGATVRAASRTPRPAAGSNPTPVMFDWRNRSTWAPVLEAVNSLYLVKPELENVVEIISDFLNAAKDSGLRRIVLLSEIAADTRSEEAVERQVERLVEQSGFDWTILRPNWYLQDLVNENFFGTMLRQGRMMVMTTGGAATAWIDARDIAAVAVELLLGDKAIGQALTLTGPEAVTLEKLTARIGAAIGTPVQPVEESTAEAEERMRGAGFHEHFISYLSSIGRSIMRGDTALLTDEVARLTGRQPRGIDAFLAEHAPSMQPAASRTAEQESAELRLSRENERLFRRQLDAWARNDLDELIALYNDDLEYVDMPFADHPVRGKAAFRAHVQEFNALFAPGTVRVDYLNIIANSTSVAGELLVHARFIGEGAPEGGAEILWSTMLVDTIVGGKVSTEHLHFDSQAFARALGKFEVVT